MSLTLLVRFSGFIIIIKVHIITIPVWHHLKINSTIIDVSYFYEKNINFLVFSRWRTTKKTQLNLLFNFPLRSSKYFSCQEAVQFMYKLTNLETQSFHLVLHQFFFFFCFFYIFFLFCMCVYSHRFFYYFYSTLHD